MIKGAAFEEHVQGVLVALAVWLAVCRIIWHLPAVCTGTDRYVPAVCLAVCRIIWHLLDLALLSSGHRHLAIVGSEASIPQ